MVQELEQVEVPQLHRSTFAGTEQSFRAFFELSHWGATIVWSRPRDFQWLALGSLGVLGAAAGLFGRWCFSKKGVTGSQSEHDETGYEGVPMVDVDRESHDRA